MMEMIKSYILFLAKFLTVLVVLLVLPIVFIATIVFSAKDSLQKMQPAPSDKLVAVVELKGEIKSSKEVLEQLYENAKDKDVKGIVLSIDSPGGAVGPSQDIYNAVNNLKKIKPIVVSMGSVAASGGLYSAMSGSKVFCQPGTTTGSIGVIMQVPNFTKIAETVGFDMVTVASGQYKDTGNPFREFTEQDRTLLMATIQNVREQFVDDIAKGRNLDRNAVSSFADGRILTGSQAKQLGLVDKFGDVYDAAREVFVILGKPLKDDEIPELRYKKDEMSRIKELLQSVLPASFSAALDRAFGANRHSEILARMY